MTIPGKKTLRRTALQLAARVRRCDVVLGYHRVNADGRDPFGLAIAVSQFEEQVEAIVRTRAAAPLEDVAAAIESGKGPSGRIAITFDDGYLDTLAVAAPILERLGLPFTVFVTTGALGRAFWWDRLARAFAERRATSSPLVIEAGGRRISLPAGATDDGRASPELGRGFETLAALPVSERDAALDRLDSGLAGESCARAMSADELRRLATMTGAEIGAHGVTHAALDALPVESMREEISGSGRELERLLGRPVRFFSYPHGRTSDAARRAVETTGYAAACTSGPSQVFRGADRLLIPRVWAPGVGGSRFTRWLGRWTGA